MWRLAGKVAVLSTSLVLSLPQQGVASRRDKDKTYVGEVKPLQGRFYALCTGDGGPQIAQFLQRRLHPVFESHYSSSTGQTLPRVQQSFRQSFDSLETEITEAARKPLQFGFSRPVYVGATALAAVVTDTYYVIANLGDAQACLFSLDSEGQLTGKSLCAAHSLTNPNELEKLKKQHPRDGDLVTNERVKGRVKVTRAFGHLDLKHREFDNPEQLDATLGFLPAKSPYTGPYLSHTPDVVSGTVAPNDRFLVLASHSLWQSTSMSEVQQILAEAKSPQEASDLISRKGTEGSTVIVVQLSTNS